MQEKGGYEFVEYIEIQEQDWANSPYINTGVIPALPFSMTADTVFTGTQSGSSANYSYGNANVANSRVGLRVFRNGGPYIIPSYGNGEIYNWVISNDSIANVRVSMKFELTSSKVQIYLNGSSIRTQSISGKAVDSPLYILAGRNASGTAEWSFVGRAYGYKIESGGSLVRDFVPAVRKSDGAVGMVDLLGNPSPFDGTPFYGNSGSGAFIYG